MNNRHRTVRSEYHIIYGQSLTNAGIPNEFTLIVRDRLTREQLAKRELMLQEISADNTIA